MVENELISLGERVVERFKKEKLTLSTAESCTGGWLSKIITEISGASEIFMGGVCSYSNSVKMDVLGVKEDTLKTFGAVSEETAREMSQGVLKLMKTSVGVGITSCVGAAVAVGASVSSGVFTDTLQPAQPAQPPRFASSNASIATKSIPFFVVLFICISPILLWRL